MVWKLGLCVWLSYGEGEGWEQTIGMLGIELNGLISACRHKEGVERMWEREKLWR